jgi:hypothetical protein
MAISHAGHNHPATPAGRRACRAGNDLAAAPVVRGTTHQTTENVEGNREIRMTGAVARRIARQAVAADNARRGTCPQAALHVKAHGGRCACGWSA